MGYFFSDGKQAKTVDQVIVSIPVRAFGHRQPLDLCVRACSWLTLFSSLLSHFLRLGRIAIVSFNARPFDGSTQ